LTRKNKLPIFPNDYLGKKVQEYDNSKSMERNQKRSTLLSIEYLFDKNLDEISRKPLIIEDSFLILDLGCGTGFSSEILIENGFRVIGVDILGDMIFKARAKKKVIKNYKELELILADINFLPIKYSKINHIISISSYNFIIYGLENYGEKVKLLNDTAKCLYKTLKENGRIIIEFYPKDEKELNIFKKSFINNGFEGFLVKKNPLQKAGQTFLLLIKIT
jgi:SAM-dependent methyltransferase